MKKIFKFSILTTIILFVFGGNEISQNRQLEHENFASKLEKIDVSKIELTNPFTTSTLTGSSDTLKIAFTFAGQSNILPTVGDTYLDLDEVFPEQVFQWGRYGGDANTIRGPTYPLQHYDNLSGLGWKGIAVGFTQRFVETYPKSKIVIIACGDGGTGFNDGRWSYGGVNYLDAINRTNDFFTAHPEYQVGGMIWHQGEDDKAYWETYTDSLDVFIDRVRTNITRWDNNTPFVLGGLLPYNVGLSSDGFSLDSIIRDTPNRKANVYFADPAIPTELTRQDEVHFDALGSYEFGRRYAEKWINRN